MTKRQTILLTGGAGFIGSHLAKRLLDLGNEVVIVDDFNSYYDPKLKEARIAEILGGYKFKIYKNDISDLDSLKKIFSENSIDVICHLAAQAGVRYSLENPFLYEKSNILGTLNLLELAKDFKVQNFIYASSSSVYGGNKKIPFSEEDKTPSPVSLYAATKIGMEAIACVYHNLYKINCTGLRYFTVYGSWGRPDMAYFKFSRLISLGYPIDVYNSGVMRRDFTYIDDIVEGTILAIEKKYPNEIFNLGNNHPEDLVYFIELLEKNLGKKAEKKMLPMRPGDVLETYADISKAKKLLGWEPKTSLEEGIKKFIAWYKEKNDFLKTLHYAG